MMISNVDIVPTLAAGTAARPPAPPIALPAVHIARRRMGGRRV